ncbi:MAG: hypothetical protein C5B49_12090 [Bdellovibrio sp.]|nr:MAG: hypothetical protein C5B49_12090 [Bdellovibrio sp.]
MSFVAILILPFYGFSVGAAIRTPPACSSISEGAGGGTSTSRLHNIFTVKMDELTARMKRIEQTAATPLEQLNLLGVNGKPIDPNLIAKIEAAKKRYYAPGLSTSDHLAGMRAIQEIRTALKESVEFGGRPSHEVEKLTQILIAGASAGFSFFNVLHMLAHVMVLDNQANQSPIDDITLRSVLWLRGLGEEMVRLREKHRKLEGFSADPLLLGIQEEAELDQLFRLLYASASTSSKVPIDVMTRWLELAVQYRDTKGKSRDISMLFDHMLDRHVFFQEMSEEQKDLLKFMWHQGNTSSLVNQIVNSVVLTQGSSELVHELGTVRSAIEELREESGLR